MASRDDDFLARWSRRKADSRHGLTPKEAAPEARNEPAAERAAPRRIAPARIRAKGESDQTAALPTDRPFAEQLRIEESEPIIPENLTPAARDEEVSEEEAALEEFKDVDFSKLDYESDYSRFMEKGVPESIRKRALRALWGSNPILANVDGLNDYDEDFTDAALAVKGILQSAYKPGSGYLTEEERLASYSDEAREAGPPEEAEAASPDDADDLDDEEDFGEDRIASGDAMEEPTEGGASEPGNREPDRDETA
jgi:hypothetical protein